MRKKMISTSAGGFKEDSFPFRLYQKAKKLGIWNPTDIDFTKDKEDWAAFAEEQKQGIIGGISAFLGGEEAVTLDLLPEIMMIAEEGRIEEEMFLTTFLFEEAKHTEFFRLFLNEVGVSDDLSHFHHDSYKKVFYEMLPEAMNRLKKDQSPEALADAAVVYNMFVEGVLAEGGFRSFTRMFSEEGDLPGLMPGLMEGFKYIKRDESRHIAYGTYLLQRLVSEHPHIYSHISNKIEELRPLSKKFNEEGGNVDEELADINQFAQAQLTLRLEKIARAKDKPLEEIYRSPQLEGWD